MHWCWQACRWRLLLSVNGEQMSYQSVLDWAHLRCSPKDFDLQISSSIAHHLQLQSHKRNGSHYCPPLSLRSFTSLGSFSWTWSIAMIRSPPCTRRNHSPKDQQKGASSSWKGTHVWFHPFIGNRNTRYVRTIFSHAYPWPTHECRGMREKWP